MSKKHKRILWPLLIVGCMAVALGVTVSTGTRAKIAHTRPTDSATPTPSPATKNQVRHGLLLPQLRFALVALGNRLEKPGNERLKLSGLLSQPGQTQPAPLIVILELPSKMRVSLQQGVSQRTLVFDGQKAQSSDGKLDQQSLALLETLAYDTVDRFFIGQMGETVPRPLGDHFRADDGTTPNYPGPFFDILSGDRQYQNGS
jgi:hypothetical protein